MTRIESRPSRKRKWDYVFFIDLDGHAEDEPFATRSTRSRRRRRCSRCSARIRKPSSDLGRDAASERFVPCRDAHRRPNHRPGRQVDLASRADARRDRQGYDDRSWFSRRARTASPRMRRSRPWASPSSAAPAGSCASTASGCSGLRAPAEVLDLGNSGTAHAAADGAARGTAFDQRARGRRVVAAQRPMERVAAPLAARWARGSTRGGRPPVAHRRRRAPARHATTRCRWRARRSNRRCCSRRSAPSGTTTVRSPGPSRDHTERMLQSMGVRLGLSSDGAGHTVTLNGPATLRGFEVACPGRLLSSAAFFLVAGCLGARDGLLIENVGINPTRTGLLAILRDDGRRDRAAQPTQRRRRAGRRSVRPAKRAARGSLCRRELVPLAIDEFPILFIAAAAANGRNDRQRRGRAAQEGDATVSRSWRRGSRPLGIDGRGTARRCAIVGGRLRGGTVDSRGDHRIAMSFAVASLRASERHRDPRHGRGGDVLSELCSTSHAPSACRYRPAVTARDGLEDRPRRHDRRAQRVGQGDHRPVAGAASSAGTFLDSGALYRLVALAACTPRTSTSAMRGRSPGGRGPERAIHGALAGGERVSLDGVDVSEPSCGRNGPGTRPRRSPPCRRFARHSAAAARFRAFPRAWWPTAATWAPLFSRTPRSKSS